MPFLHTASGRLVQLSHLWRLFASGLGFVIFGLIAVATAMLFAIVVRPLPRVDASTRRDWALNTIRWLSWLFVTLLHSLGLCSLRYRQQARLTTSGAVVVANHPSLIDGLLIGAHTPRLCCVVKPALFSNPFTSYLVRTAGYLRSDSPTLIDDAVSVIRSGDNLLLFPEGTRNTDDTTLAFRRGAAHVALTARCPIVPVTIDFHPRALQKGDSWYDIPSSPSTIIVSVLASVEPCTQITADVPITLVARRLTRQLRDLFVLEVSKFVCFTDAAVASRDPASLPAAQSPLDGSTQ